MSCGAPVRPGLLDVIKRYPPGRVRLPYAAPGQTVGLYGGSFDPIHDGHVLVAEQAMKRLRLDWLWWLVTPGNPLKAHDPTHGLTARMDAVLQQAKHPRRKVLGVEADMGVRYTADTVAMLATMRPDLAFVWIMGADNLAGFHRWNAWRVIADSVPFVVIDRPGSRHASLSAPTAQTLASRRLDAYDAAMLARVHPPAWTFVRGPLSPLSSSALRAVRPTQSGGLS